MKKTCISTAFHVLIAEMQTIVFLFHGKEAKVSFLIVNKGNLFVICNYCHEMT